MWEVNCLISFQYIYRFRQCNFMAWVNKCAYFAFFFVAWYQWLILFFFFFVFNTNDCFCILCTNDSFLLSWSQWLVFVCVSWSKWLFFGFLVSPTFLFFRGPYDCFWFHFTIGFSFVWLCLNILEEMAFVYAFLVLMTIFCFLSAL